MSLPFLKTNRNNNAGVIVQHRASDEPENDNKDDGLETCLEEMHAAMDARDYKQAARSLRAAFQICDSEPHEEGEHTNDYDDLNEQAAE
jgi:hypothetical protein